MNLFDFNLNEFWQIPGTASEYSHDDWSFGYLFVWEQGTDEEVRELDRVQH